MKKTLLGILITFALMSTLIVTLLEFAFWKGVSKVTK